MNGVFVPRCESVRHWASVHPERVALRCEGEHLTYRELNARIQGLADELADIGVGSGDLVAIGLELGIDAVVSVLAVLRAAAVFLPLDIDAPALRSEAILADARVAALISDPTSALTGPRGCRLVDPRPDSNFGESALASLTTDDQAYVIYTSGSSGVPKGVSVSHGNLDFYLRRAEEHYPSDGHGGLLHSPLSFDLSITTLFVTLARGETLSIVPSRDGVDALATALVEQERIGLLKLTPSHLRLLNAAVAPGALAGRVSSLIVGGEALFHQDLHRWRAESPHTRIFNEYGPTETTVGVIVHEVRGETAEGPVPIGVPFDGVEARLVDADGSDLGVGETGELLILGPCVAKGYIGHDPGEPFGILPDRPDSYRTGDLALRLPDGSYLYRGRSDDQIKLAGHRIEPAEIEQAVRQHPGVRDAAVIATASTARGQRLIAYVVPEDSAPDGRELSSFLAERLPRAMVPTAFERVTELPRTSNGKIDRPALVNGQPVTDDDSAAARDGTDIAIVGIDCVFPGAVGPEEFWRLLRSGADGLTVLTDEQLLASGVAPERFERPGYTRVTGVISDIDGFDAEFFGISAAEAQFMDPQHRLLMQCVWRSLENAGHCAEQDRRRTGLFAGVSANTYLYTQIIPHWDAIGTDGTELQLLMGAEKDFAPARIAYQLDLRGPTVAVQTGCSTGLVAAHAASRSLLTGECDFAVAAAACIRVPHQVGADSRDGGIVSRSGRCAAFDVDADGSVQGNGVAAVVLRRLSDALRDGDTVYAVLAGAAINNDGQRKVGFAAPSVEGQREVIQTAHLAAGVRPEEVSYVEAHGTATKLGDPVEAEALRQAFGGATGCAVGSVKNNIGHLDTAAGLAGLIKTTLALHYAELPPSRNFTRLNPAIFWPEGTFTVQRELAAWPGGPARVAGVSAFSVGGTNAHAVLRGAPARRKSQPTDEAHCIPLSARRREDLMATAVALAESLEQQPGLDLGDVAFTLQHGRAVHAERMALVARTLDELCRQLRSPDLEQFIGAGTASAISLRTDDVHAAAAAWRAGQAVDWDAWHHGRRRSRVALPGTVFRKTRHWVPETSRGRAAAAPAAGILYAPQWRPEPSWPGGSEQPTGWLMFAGDSPLSDALITRLRDRGEPVCEVRPGQAFVKTGAHEWTVGPDRDDYHRLLAEIEGLGVQPNRVVHAWQTGGRAPARELLSLDSFDRGIAHGLVSLMNLGWAIGRLPTRHDRHLAIITEHQFAFGSAEAVDPARAASLGPALVYPQEIEGLTTALFDVAGLSADQAAERLEADLASASPGVFALRRAGRYRRELAPLPTATTKPQLPVRDETWLVTGGFGGVGFEVAKDLAAAGANLVLLDRPTSSDIGSRLPAGTGVTDLAAAHTWLSDELSARTRAARVPLIHDDPELVDRLNAMSAASVLDVLRRMGITTGAGDTTTITEITRRGRIQPKFARMLAFMVGCIEAAGLCHRTGEQLHFTGHPALTAHEARRDVVEWAPDLAELMDFLGSCVDRLPEVLSGETDAAAVLYPHGSEASMEAAARITMRRSIGSVQADLIADWIGHLADRHPTDQPLRLLEFGAGNGLLTGKVVDVLAQRGRRVEYWISDIGRTFTAKARRLYGDRLPGIHATALDISRDPGEQGFHERDFDLVFGLNVVHATKDVRASLTQLRKLLAPGGLVALLESIKFEPWVDLVAGLAEGWWYFDDAYRTTSPLLDTRRWLAAMADAGLDGGFALPDTVPELDRADCAVIVGREPEGDRHRTRISAKRAMVSRLEELGAHVTVLTADVTAPTELRAALDRSRDATGPIHGLVHCAAQVRGGMIASMSAADAAAELGAKTRGALALLDALSGDPLRTAVLSSSLNVHFGGEGQTAYVAANAALGGISDALSGGAVHVVAVDWDRWEGVGLAASFQRSFEAVRRHQIGSGMSAARGIEAFHAAATSGLPQIAMSVEPFHAKYAGYLSANRHLARDAPTAAGTHASDAIDAIGAGLVALCRELLGDEHVESGHRLVDVGADSILVLQLQAELEQRIGIQIFTAALMGQTLDQLARACVAPGEHPGTVLVLDEELLAKAIAEGIA